MNSKKVKSYLLSVALLFAGLSFVSSSSVAATPVGELPPQVAQDTTSLLFFFWGYLDGEDEIEWLSESGLPYSLRQIAAIIRSQITIFAAHPYSIAYLYGRLIAYERAADRLGEP